MLPAGDLRRPVARPAPVLLVAASLACWAVQASSMLAGAVDLRSCSDECHATVLGPLTPTVVLAPLGIGLLVAGVVAWNGAGHEAPAPRLLRVALLSVAVAAAIVTVAGTVSSLTATDGGHRYEPSEVAALVNLGALAVACLLLARPLRD